MEALTWWQYYWQALLKAIEFPNNILGIIGIVFLFIKLIPPKYERERGDGKLKMYYQWIKRHSIRIFAVLVILTLIYAPYGLYKDNQVKLDMFYETNKPRLRVDADITEGTISAYLPTQLVTFNVNYQIQNISDIPAYQTRFRGFISPLNEPEQLIKYKEIYQFNPIFKGTNDYQINQAYYGNYSVIGTDGIVMLYAQIAYSDQPEGGHWSSDEFWFPFSLDLTSNRSIMVYVKPEWRDKYRPSIDQLYPNWRNGGDEK